MDHETKRNMPGTPAGTDQYIRALRRGDLQPVAGDERHCQEGGAGTVRDGVR